MNTSIFKDDSENAFGPGQDKRKSTITYAQAMEVMRVLNNLGFYGQIFVNQEGFGADYVEADPGNPDELIYVLLYAGQYHELAEIAVTLDKSPKTAVVKRISQILMNYTGDILNIPTVGQAVETALDKLF